MAKYQVEGFVKFKMEVEAESEDDALEVAQEDFSFEKHVGKDEEPEFTVANPLEGEDDEEEETSIRHRSASYDSEDDD